jgi:hypothetical protein
MIAGISVLFALQADEPEQVHGFFALGPRGSHFLPFGDSGESPQPRGRPQELTVEFVRRDKPEEIKRVLFVDAISLLTLPRSDGAPGAYWYSIKLLHDAEAAEPAAAARPEREWTRQVIRYDPARWKFSTVRMGPYIYWTEDLKTKFVRELVVCEPYPDLRPAAVLDRNRRIDFREAEPTPAPPLRVPFRGTVQDCFGFVALGSSTRHYLPIRDDREPPSSYGEVSSVTVEFRAGETVKQVVFSERLGMLKSNADYEYRLRLIADPDRGDPEKIDPASAESPRMVVRYNPERWSFSNLRMGNYVYRGPEPAMKVDRVLAPCDPFPDRATPHIYRGARRQDFCEAKPTEPPPSPSLGVPEFLCGYVSLGAERARQLPSTRGGDGKWYDRGRPAYIAVEFRPKEGGGESRHVTWRNFLEYNRLRMSATYGGDKPCALWYVIKAIAHPAKGAPERIEPSLDDEPRMIVRYNPNQWTLTSVSMGPYTYRNPDNGWKVFEVPLAAREPFREWTAPRLKHPSRRFDFGEGGPRTEREFQLTDKPPEGEPVSDWDWLPGAKPVAEVVGGFVTPGRGSPSKVTVEFRGRGESRKVEFSGEQMRFRNQASSLWYEIRLIADPSGGEPAIESGPAPTIRFDPRAWNFSAVKMGPMIWTEAGRTHEQPLGPCAANPDLTPPKTDLTLRRFDFGPVALKPLPPVIKPLPVPPIKPKK